MLTKEISKVEKRFRKLSLSIKPTEKEVDTMSEYEWITTIYPRRIFEETLKSVQAKFDKFVKDLKCGIYGKLNGNYPDNNLELYQWLEEIIDELSSKQEGKC